MFSKKRKCNCEFEYHDEIEQILKRIKELEKKQILDRHKKVYSILNSYPIRLFPQTLRMEALLKKINGKFCTHAHIIKDRLRNGPKSNKESFCRPRILKVKKVKLTIYGVDYRYDTEIIDAEIDTVSIWTIWKTQFKKLAKY